MRIPCIEILFFRNLKQNTFFKFFMDYFYRFYGSFRKFNFVRGYIFFHASFFRLIDNRKWLQITNKKNSICWIYKNLKFPKICENKYNFDTVSAFIQLPLLMYLS